MVAILFWPQCVKQLFNPLYAGLFEKKKHKIHFHVLLVLNLEKFTLIEDDNVLNLPKSVLFADDLAMHGAGS